MTQLRVAGIELVEDGAPPIVHCTVFDAAGVRHEFFEKLPIVSRSDRLSIDEATIACSFVALRRDHQDRRIITIDTACPWGCETNEGLTVLDVFEQQLAPSDDVWIALNGARLPASRFGTNDGLNYGRHVDDGLVYQATLPLACLDWCAGDFAQLVDDLREDDEQFGDPTPFAGCEYRRTLTEAAAFPDALAESVNGFIDRELLTHHFRFHEATTEFVINSTDAVFVVAGQIIIRGRCWRRRHGG